MRRVNTDEVVVVVVREQEAIWYMPNNTRVEWTSRWSSNLPVLAGWSILARRHC